MVLLLVHYPTCARLLPLIEAQARLQQWISWVYPSNIGHTKKRFTTAHRALLWFVHEDCKQPLFYPERDTQPYRILKTQELRAKLLRVRLGLMPTIGGI